jgi:hypothetical protein
VREDSEQVVGVGAVEGGGEALGDGGEARREIELGVGETRETN